MRPNKKQFEENLKSKIVILEELIADLNLIYCLVYKYQKVYVSLDDASRGSPKDAFWRQVVMYIGNTEFGINYETMSKLINRDRATVLHACKVIEDARDHRPFDEWLTNLSSVIQSFKALDGPVLDIKQARGFNYDY